MYANDPPLRSSTSKLYNIASFLFSNKTLTLQPYSTYLME